LTIELPPWLAVLVTLVVCGGALWKGDWEERLTASVLLLTFAVTLLLRDMSWPRVQAAEFTSDFAGFAVLVAIALRSRKFWPMFAAAFELLAVMTHVAKTIDPELHQWAYLTAIIIWTYLILIALGVGTWNAWRTRRLAPAS
jgi:hypothetical protein